MKAQQHLELLGKSASDAVTGFKGVILAELMGTNFGGENREQQAGHELQHLLGKTDPDYVPGSKHLGGF